MNSLEKGVNINNKKDIKKLEGLGGWLWLVMLGIIINPLRIIGELAPIYFEIFSDGIWEVLTTPGTEAYNSLVGTLILGELIINVILFFWWLFIAFIFFSKKKIFSKWYIGILLFTLVFIFVDALAVKAIFPNEPMFDPDTTKEFFRSLVVSLIWIPYVLTSERVKNTFVK